MLHLIFLSGEKIGWSENQIKQYSMLLNKIVTPILNLCKKHQIGRVTKKVTDVTFDFSEGWFRYSVILIIPYSDIKNTKNTPLI